MPQSAPPPATSAATLPRQIESPDCTARLWPLVVAGMVLEAVWLVTAALTYPLAGSPAYAKNWVTWLGPLWSGFEWILLQLDALAPGLFGGDPPHPPAFALFLGLLFVGYAAYLFGIYALDNGVGSHPAALRVVVAFALIFQVTLFVMPGILTTDLASYAVLGRIAGVYGANPYLVPPSAFPADPFVPWWIARMWLTTTASYGPLWVDLSWVIARFTGSMDPMPQLVSYRLLIDLAHFANLGLFWWLLRRLTHTARLPTFVAFAWSPLLLFTVAANGHNDAVMITLMLLGCAALAKGLTANSDTGSGRPAPAGLAPAGAGGAGFAPPGFAPPGFAPRGYRAWLAALTFLVLATLVKWASGGAVLFFAVAWARCSSGWRQRLVWLGSAGVLLTGLTLLIAWPWLPGLLAPSARVNDVGLSYANWLIDVPAAWFASHVLDRDGLAIPQTRSAARVVFMIPALAVFAGLVLVELRRVWRVAQPDAPLDTIRVVVGASTRTLLAALVLVSPQLQAWYFSWPLALGLLLGWRDMTARVALTYSLLFPPVAYLREQTGGNPVDPLLVAYAVLPLMLPAVAWLRRQPDPMAAVLGQARGVLSLGRWRA